MAPAPEYTFRILVTPVGPYFKGGLKPIKLRVSEYDRAAPHGTGNIKAGLNYAMSLRPTTVSYTHLRGGCLGAGSRRRARQAAISRGEAQTAFDPRIPEWGNPAVAMPCYRPPNI